MGILKQEVEALNGRIKRNEVILQEMEFAMLNNLNHPPEPRGIHPAEVKLRSENIKLRRLLATLESSDKS